MYDQLKAMIFLYCFSITMAELKSNFFFSLMDCKFNVRVLFSSICWLKCRPFKILLIWQILHFTFLVLQFLTI